MSLRTTGILSKGITHLLVREIKLSRRYRRCLLVSILSTSKFYKSTVLPLEVIKEQFGELLKKSLSRQGLTTAFASYTSGS